MGIPPLETAEYSTLESLAALAAEWEDLWARDPGATPFQHPAWLLPWARNLWGGGKLLALAFRSDGLLVGLAPLFLWGYDASPKIIRLSWLGAGISDYTDLLAAREYAGQCADAFLWFLHEGQAWHLCRLEELPEGSALAARARTLPCSTCPVARLANTIERHLAGCDAKFRTSLRQAENRLRRAGALEILRAGESDVPAALDHLFRLHAARWREQGESGVLAAGRLQRFHREAAAALQHAGLLRLFLLRVDGQCIAVQYNLAAARTAYAYLSGFEPAWARHSPGAVLLKYSIAAAIEEGAVEFDFLRRAEAFKYQWGARDRINGKLVIARSAAARDLAEAA